MVEGTQDFKRLESMLKEVDQKKEKDLSIIEMRLEKDLLRLKGKINSVFAKIKALINGITLQHNGIQSQETLKNDPAATGSMIGEASSTIQCKIAIGLIYSDYC